MRGIITPMSKSSDIIKALGIADIAAAVGVSHETVRRAVHEEKLPAAWFDAVERLAKSKRKGAIVTRGAFAFKGMDE